MSSNRKLEIDGCFIANKEQFHEHIKTLLEFPDWYGANPAALWDLLTGHIDTNFSLTWKNYKVSQERMGNDFDVILSVLNDFEKEYPEFHLTLE